MEMKFQKITAPGVSVPLKVAGGHFATNHTHINYYIDLTTVKSRVSEAREAADVLARNYLTGMVIDTIVCLEGTEVIGALLAEELTKSGLLSMNAHKIIYVIKPEYNSNSQIIFKENYHPMLEGKHVLILTGNVTTGLTVNKGIEGIQYYGGIIQCICAVFTAVDAIDGIPVRAVYGMRELPDYQFADYRNCPICKAGKKLDGLVNPYGYSKL